MGEAEGVKASEEVEDVVIDPTRGLRYAELFAIGGELILVYNSMGLSEAPPELWEALDAEAAAKQLGVGAVIKNGPHWWMSDTSTLQFGVDPVSVGGIGFRTVARLPARVARSGKLVPPLYEVVETHKNGVLTYSAGKPVYELISPDGDAFVLQSINVEPSELPTLGERLSPVDGWQFRMRSPDADLTVSMDGKVRTVMDDFRNVYNQPPTTGGNSG